MTASTGTSADGAPAVSSLPPLCVDLDGTLVRTDTLVEAALELLRRRPWALLIAAMSLGKGRARFKSLIQAPGCLDVKSLPYNREVVQLVREARLQGRKTLLVTASSQTLAEEIATHLGCFDEVHGSRDDTNLKGVRKAEFLVEKFGRGGFDYAGDSAADIPAWRAARQGITVVEKFSHLDGASMTALESEAPVSQENELSSGARNAVKLFLYLLVVAAVCLSALRMPRMGFDAVEYVATAEAVTGADIQTIYAETIKVVKTANATNLERFYSTPFQRELLSSPARLAESVPSYRLKILHVLMIGGLQRIIGPRMVATIVPSVIGYAGVAALVWVVLGRRRALLATVVACQPVLLSYARHASPDLFATFCVLCGMFLFLADRQLWGGAILLVTIWVRPDYFFYAEFVLVAVLFFGRLDWKGFFTLTGLGCASMLTLMRFGLPWSILFYHSFIDYLPNPASAVVHVGPMMYIRQVVSALMSLSISYLGLYVLLAIFALRSREGRILIPALALGAAAHFVLYPSTEERYYLPFYVGASILAARALMEKRVGMEGHAV